MSRSGEHDQGRDESLDLVADAVQAVWPYECDLVGRSTVKGIVRGARPGPAIGENQIDVVAIAEVVGSAASVTSLVYALISGRKVRSDREVLAEVRIQLPDDVALAEVDVRCIARLRGELQESSDRTTGATEADS